MDLPRRGAVLQSTIPSGLRYVALSIAAGGLVALALPPYQVPGLIWVSLVPFFSLLTLPLPNARGQFFYGWLAGVTALGPTFAWALDAPPLTWLGVEGLGLSYLLISVSFSLLTSFLALGHGLFQVLGRRFLAGRWWDVLTLASLFTLIEYLRVFSYSFYPFTYGSGSIVGDHLGFALLGYAFADAEYIRQLSTLIGPYGLGFLAAASSASLWYLLRRMAIGLEDPGRRKTIFREVLAACAGLAVGAILLRAGGAGLRSRFYTPSRELSVGILQSNSTVRVQPARLRNLIQSQAGREGFHILLIPEGSTLFPVGEPGADEVGAVLGGDGYRLAVGSTYEGGENRLLLYDTAVGRLAVYAKRLLVPHAEYVPNITAALAKLLGGSEWLARRPRTVPGNMTAVKSTALGPISTLICMEMLSPKIVRDAVREGGEIILFASNISILRGSGTYHREVLAMAKIWATATRRFLVYSSQDEPSFIVDPQGRLLWESPDLDPGIHVATASLNSAQTPYVRYPYGFLIIGGMYLVSVGVFAKRKTKPSTAPPRENVHSV